MDKQRFQEIVRHYPALKIAVLGDFCLDRYLEIDPALPEMSIETGLPVYNVTRVRSQPGGAGTIVNNLAALGIGTIFPIGFCGDDGEGFELRRALARKPRVDLRGFFGTAERHTFTYCKPLIMVPNEPRELNRLDTKNWAKTPSSVEQRIIDAIDSVSGKIDALIVLDQVDLAETGVVTHKVAATVGRLLREYPDLLIIADSRRGLRDFPPVILKMNRQELGRLVNDESLKTVQKIKESAYALARQKQCPIIVTLSESGIVGAMPEGTVAHEPCFPVRGPIDVVGAGDAVTANLIAALTAGAMLPETLRLANAAASIVLHQIGTTGTASVEEIGAII